MPVRILNHYFQVPILLLALFEATVILLAVIVSAEFLFPSKSGFVEPALLVRAGAVSIVMLLCIGAMGLYQSTQRARIVGIMARLLVAVGIGAGVLAVLFYLFPPLFLDRRVMLLTAAMSAPIIVLGRILFSKAAVEDVFKRRILVYGAGKRARSIQNLRRRADRRGFEIAGFVRADGDDLQVDEKSIVDQPQSLATYAIEHAIDEIVVAMDDRRQGFPVGEFLECKLEGIRITNVLFFLQRETGKIDVDLMSPSWLIFSQSSTRSLWRRLIKRSIDFLTSLIVLILALPVLLLVTVAILLESGFRQPVLYRQSRVGRGDVPFNLIKFRSMRVDAEADGVAQWAEENDDRVTRVGAFLRKTRLDELPQMVNVLTGKMSLVGPRPERPEFIDRLVDKIPYYRVRHSVKPGITGWAQLSYPYGASEKDAVEKLKYDLYYVMNQTIVFDLIIILQTVEVVLWGKGAR